MSLGYDNITIVDVVLDNFNLLDDSYSHYFVVTPFTTHHEILLKLSKFAALFKIVVINIY